jgi:hypothetical protein
MLLDIYIDDSYHLTSQVRLCDSKGLEPHAEIETGSGGHSATHPPHEEVPGPFVPLTRVIGR